MIHARCVHCGDIIEQLFSSWHQYWGECQDCRLWQRYLWEQQPPQVVDDPLLQEAIKNAIDAGREGEG